MHFLYKAQEIINLIVYKIKRGENKPMVEKQMNHLFLSVIFIIIGVVLLTSFAGTVHTQTDTKLNSTGNGCNGATAGALCNVSSNAQTIYQFYDLVWAALGLVFIIGGGWSAVTTLRK